MTSAHRPPPAYSQSKREQAKTDADDDGGRREHDKVQFGQVLKVVVDREVGHYYINALTGKLAVAKGGVVAAPQDCKTGWRYTRQGGGRRAAAAARDRQALKK